MHQAALASFLFRFWLQASPRLSHGSQCLCTQLHVHLPLGPRCLLFHNIWSGLPPCADTHQNLNS